MSRCAVVSLCNAPCVSLLTTSLNSIHASIPTDGEVPLVSTESEKREQAVSFATIESSLTTVEKNLSSAREIQSICGVAERDEYEER